MVAACRCSDGGASAWTRVATGLAMLASALPACAADTIWVSRSATGFPTYSARPLDASAEPALRFAPRPVAPWAGSSARVAPYPRAPGAPQLRLPPLQLQALAERIAGQHRVELPLVLAIVDVESGFRPHALSPAGAMGLMQLMPATARRYRVDDPWSPAANLDGGVRYLRDLLQMFDGDLQLALAGYNAGEGAVLRHGRRIPPFAETRAYVPAVLARRRFWQGQLQQAARVPVDGYAAASVLSTGATRP